MIQRKQFKNILKNPLGYNPYNSIKERKDDRIDEMMERHKASFQESRNERWKERCFYATLLENAIY